jgi:hypothetical protein
MTARITSIPGAEAYDLIFPDHLAMLSSVDQETMQRTMSNSSRVWIGFNDDAILCAFGLIPPTMLSNRAYLWLYTTHHMTEHVFVFIRHSQRMVQEMLQEFPVIVGHGTTDAPRSLRWLHWLGAKFGEPQGRFLPFTIEASQWQQRSVRLA